MPRPDPDRFALEAPALADPTRRAIFRAVLGRPEGITVAELTAAFQLNHNAIRQHLFKLRDASLVEEAVEAGRAGPGRPRLRYTPSPRALQLTGPSAYEELAVLLARVAATRADPRETGRTAGRVEVATATPAPAPSDPIASVVAHAARAGFEPKVRERGGETEIVLTACPFEAAALAAPGIVCALHRGLAEGIVDAVGGARVVDLELRDPRRAGCRLRLIADATPD